jgi:hypothetical protein
MTWTQPKTWTSEPLIAGDLNTHLRDNLEALKEPPSADYTLNEISDYSTTSIFFVDVDSVKFSMSIETNGGDVMVGFYGTFKPGSNSNIGYFDVELDGDLIGGDDGLIACERAATSTTPNKFAVSFVRLVTGLAAGSHIFKLQWKVNGGSGDLYAGAGTSDLDVHPQFWVREVS